MQKLFESKTNQAADGLPNTVDAKIIIDLTPYLLYYQFDLDDVYRMYFKSAMVSENLLRTGIRKLLFKKVTSLLQALNQKQ